MKPRIHVITLAVADLDRALAFYRDGLGFQTEGLIGAEFTGNQTIPDGTTVCSTSTAGSCCRYIRAPSSPKTPWSL
jgi:catechol 2,3-dioxygenase-like lactoylglutathione lyase family enzyme